MSRENANLHCLQLMTTTRRKALFLIHLKVVFFSKCKEKCQHYTGTVPSHSLALFHLLLSKSMDVLFLLISSLGATKEKNPAESLNAVPWLRSVWQSSHLFRTLKCLFQVCPSTFRMFLEDSHHRKAQKYAGVKINSRAVKGLHICAHSASPVCSQCNNLSDKMSSFV